MNCFSRDSSRVDTQLLSLEWCHVNVQVGKNQPPELIVVANGCASVVPVVATPTRLLPLVWLKQSRNTSGGLILRQKENRPRITNNRVADY